MCETDRTQVKPIVVVRLTEANVDGPDGSGDFNDPNSFFIPEVTKNIIRLAKDFVLCTGVMVPAFKSPKERGVSAPVESDFADPKKNILRGQQTPLRVDKFVAIHLEAIEGACRIAGARQQLSNAEDRQSQNETDTHQENRSEQPSNATDSGGKSNDKDAETNNSTASEGDEENETEKEGPEDLNHKENWGGLAMLKK